MTLKDDNQNPNTTKNALGAFLPKSKVPLGKKYHMWPHPLLKHVVFNVIYRDNHME